MKSRAIKDKKSSFRRCGGLYDIIRVWKGQLVFGRYLDINPDGSIEPTSCRIGGVQMGQAYVWVQE